MEVHHLHATIFNEDDFVAKCLADKIPELSDVTKCGSNLPDELALNINAQIIQINSGEYPARDIPYVFLNLHKFWNQIHLCNISKFDFMPIVLNLSMRTGYAFPIMYEVMGYLERMQVLDRILNKINKK